MKKKVAVLFGGVSPEHEVSLISGQAVIDNLNKDLFDVSPVIISKKGEFDEEKVKSADFIFPVLHGIGGEDGTMQLYLEELGKPYAGCGSKSSAVALDKILSKGIWQNHNLPIPSFTYFNKDEWVKNKEEIIKKISLPGFIKPFNTGSSLGISKVKTKEEIISAVNEAFKICDKIIAEESIENIREIEVGIVGNNELIISKPGEVVPCEEFYTFDAKYKGNSKIIIPAEISSVKVTEIRELAEKAYNALECRGFARVDLFMQKPEGKIFLNEINTIPGFTQFSMFPKLMENSGINFERLLNKIIELGLENAKI
ncbi:TPA: D-alanine--D-alanine ligase [Candidatus Berkelbacteria bacterium]|uniref:D-alanine--D-alanine ligase n=1 Tax=Berkelbacteria bacterium GW2011_GWE1_39_12 TaxID=1618337 RepID=A0A0G4B3R7_9BACT|nr:MAG: ddl, D-alanyl-alanine synthetase A, D-alanine-D-alanine ligase [Berkelbacteria bacterium GW2011_GWE1_39_12]HBO60415.1 D-alanine--D-alanine ligase [Candidatus Berkelbacteria bacterium]